MNSYYRFCENIADSYYPMIYKQIIRHVQDECNKYDSEYGDFSFPLPDKFEQIKEKIHQKYIEETNELYRNGEFIYFYNIDFRNNIIRDFIGIIVLDEFLNRRKKYENHPYFY